MEHPIDKNVLDLYQEMQGLSKSARQRDEKAFIKDNLQYVVEIAEELGVEVYPKMGRFRYDQAGIDRVGDLITQLGDMLYQEEIAPSGYYDEYHISRAKKIRDDTLIIFEADISGARGFRLGYDSGWDHEDNPLDGYADL